MDNCRPQMFAQVSFINNNVGHQREGATNGQQASAAYGAGCASNREKLSQIFLCARRFYVASNHFELTPLSQQGICKCLHSDLSGVADDLDHRILLVYTPDLLGIPDQYGNRNVFESCPGDSSKDSDAGE